MIITLSLLASIDVFKSGADGYNCYRIPSMITLPGGRIFAFAEGRLHDCYDAARCRRGTRCGASTRRSGGTCSRCRV